MSIHYIWITCLAVVGSICLYPNGHMRYIDALFLASGAATQSGLNTIDINLLTTWQQLALYFESMLGNPITINSFVVFLRLYWFEKEFQEVTTNAWKNRRTIMTTITKSKTEERDAGREERGVGGRSIVVMHEGTETDNTANNTIKPEDSDSQLEKAKAVAQEGPNPSTSNSGESSNTRRSYSRERSPRDMSPHLQIKFADQVKRSDGMADETLRMPVQRSEEEHIAILQRQRNPSDNAVLRIPGPRDADAGVAPEEVDVDDVVLSQTLSRRASTFDSSRDLDIGSVDDTNRSRPAAPKRNITIQEPTRQASPTDHMVKDAAAATHAVGSFWGVDHIFRHRRPRVLHEENPSTNDSHTTHGRKRAGTLNSLKQAISREKEDGIPYLSWEPTVGRNSTFVDLTEEQREELGGIEYRSLKSLALILTCYFWGFSIFGVICLTPWIQNSRTYGSVVTGDGQGRAWWGIFTANSAFTDLGYTLTPDSMISFQTAIWPLLLMSFLIIIGNTGFPVMLRIIIWITSKWVPRGSGIYEELNFLLDHPRRCFTLLFPSKATWWLFWILVILNGVDLLFFIVLDLGNSIVTQLPVHVRVLDGWFQAVSTRTAGFGVVDLADLHPAIQVSYLVMMYISVLPIAISVRRTNVYEEKSLGLYGSPEEEAAEDDKEKEPSYVGSHLRRQLSFDLWYIFLGFFVIAIAEGSKLQNDPNFTMFSVLFEIVSAYGTVGLSLGYVNTNASLSAQFSVISKLVIIAMQIRGRHRGLPYALDKAIMLPSANLQQQEIEDAAQRIRRQSSFATDGPPIMNFPSMAPVSSGAAKVRSHSRSSHHQTRNIISDLLHIGPPLPESHRNPRKIDDFERPHRRYSTASAPPVRGRMARSVSPSHMAGNYSGSFDAMGTRRRQTSGRRHFYEDGINEPPAAINET